MSSNAVSNRIFDSVREVIKSLRTLLGVLLLAALTGCFAADDEPNHEPEPGTGPLLYEIVSADGATEGWMLGTIHLLPDGVAWRTEAIDEVVDQADLLMVEIADLEDRNAIAKLFVELGTTHGLPDITQRVPRSERTALLDLIKRSGLTPDAFSAIETWAAALMLAQGNAIGSAENGVDKAILNDFRGRDVREFEGAALQLSIFDRLAEEDQRALLSATIAEPETAREDAQKLLTAWLTGDADTIEELTETGAMEDPEVRDALLVDRNTLWIRKLIPVLRTPDKPLIAVGAAHLVGPDGLPALLEARGYTVRRLSSAPK